MDIEPPRRADGRTPASRTAITIRCTREWRDWVEGLGAASRVPVSVLVDLALARFAEQEGHGPKPPRRS